MKKFWKPEYLVSLAGCGLIIYLLFVGPFIGVADNGDFLRMMNTIGLNYYDTAASYTDQFLILAILVLRMRICLGASILLHRF